MREALLCAVAVLIAAAPVQAREEKSFSDPADLAAEITQLQHSLNPQTAPRIRATLPSAWRVHTPDGDFTLATAPLQSMLDHAVSGAGTVSGAGKDHLTTDAQTWLNSLAIQLRSYRSPPPHAAQSRAALELILARPEFAGNAPPTAWERFRDRASGRLLNWLKRLFVFSFANSGSFTLLFCLALAVAVSLLFFILLRLLTRDKYNFKLNGAPQPASALSSGEWLRAARSASLAGDFRKAIQCAYWAGVAHLQQSDALPQTTTYTPREYLRLLSAAAGKQDALLPLRTLTAHLERFWYARATAAAEDFSRCLLSLEALGCPLD